jgi:HPt (histidine-containing phosphotransfer) domain-containing protein
MTANALEGEDEKCYAAGMDDYLAKPVKRSQFAATLDRWLATQPASAETRALGKSIDQALLDRLRDLEQMLGPDLVHRLIETFLKDATQRLADLDMALTRQDGDKLARIVHSLKGSAANLGAVTLVHLCEDLERTTRAEHLDGTAAALSALHHHYADLQVQLETFQTTMGGAP